MKLPLWQEILVSLHDKKSNYKDLAYNLGSNISYMSGIVKKLQDIGYVKVQKDGNNRILSLTLEGMSRALWLKKLKKEAQNGKM
jgi:DNA-binding MarR family transcriptional regulator